jgi:hypothetical protein
VVLDTLMSATSLEDVNDNSGVVVLMKQLRGLAEAHGCAFIVAHHHRKGVPGERSGHAMMGARQLAGQADMHVTLRPADDGQWIEERPDGAVDQFTAVVLETAKHRDEVPGKPQRVVIHSRKEAGRLACAEVRNEGDVEPKAKLQDLMTSTIRDALAEAVRPMRRGEIADAVGKNTNDGTFARALRDGLGAGHRARRRPISSPAVNAAATTAAIGPQQTPGRVATASEGDSDAAGPPSRTVHRRPREVGTGRQMLAGTSATRSPRRPRPGATRTRKPHASRNSPSTAVGADAT